MTIPVNTSIKQYFNVCIQILNPWLNLTRIQQDVLSSYLLLHYTNISNPDIDNLLFKADTRKHLRTSLKLSEASFNNVLCSLKKKKIIVDNKFTSILLNNYPVKDKNNELTFKFTIKNEQSK